MKCAGPGEEQHPTCRIRGRLPSRHACRLIPRSARGQRTRWAADWASWPGRPRSARRRDQGRSFLWPMVFDTSFAYSRAEIPASVSHRELPCMLQRSRKLRMIAGASAVIGEPPVFLSLGNAGTGKTTAARLAGIPGTVETLSFHSTAPRYGGWLPRCPLRHRSLTRRRRKQDAGGTRWEPGFTDLGGALGGDDFVRELGGSIGIAGRDPGIEGCACLGSERRSRSRRFTW